jgi:hypothetical protein
MGEVEEPALSEVEWDLLLCHRGTRHSGRKADSSTPLRYGRNDNSFDSQTLKGRIGRCTPGELYSHSGSCQRQLLARASQVAEMTAPLRY